MANVTIETYERPGDEAALARTFMIAAALIFAIAAAIAYWFERAYRRWWKANHPFAGPKARFESMGTTYRDRRAGLAEVVSVIGGIAAEMARAFEHARPSPDRSGSEGPTM